MKFPHRFFEGLGQLSCQMSHFWICLCISSWANVFGTKHYLGDNVPQRTIIVGGSEESVGGIQYFEIEWISSFPVTLTCCTHWGPWLESTSPFAAQSGDLQTVLFHLHFLVFCKEERCLCFSSHTLLSCILIYQCRFMFLKFNVYNPSLLEFFLRLRCPDCPTCG